jgi:hypothetical protein
MYKISRYETFKESDLSKFEVQHIQLYLNSLCLYIEINVTSANLIERSFA